MSKQPLQPIIVIGAARSGTKVLRDALATAAGAGRVPYDVGYVWRYGNESSPHDCLESAAVQPKTRSLVLAHLRKYAGADGLVVEKTVGNTLRVPFVEEILPDAKYVYLERDGVDVVMSTQREWQAPTDWRYVRAKARHFPPRLIPSYGRKYLRAQTIDRRKSDGHVGTWGPRYPGIDADLAADGLLRVCARQWKFSVTTATAALEQVGAPVVQVSYAALTRTPDAVLAGILDQFGLPVDAQRLVRAASMLDPSASRPTRGGLTTGDRAILTAEIGGLLEERGYEQP